MNRYILTLMVLALLAPSLMSCSGEVLPPADMQAVPLQLRSTVWGIEQAMAGRTGSIMMMKDNLLLFGWGIKDGWGFALMNSSTRPIHNYSEVIPKGSIVNARTMKDFVTCLERGGWKVVTASQLPQTFAWILKTASLVLANSLTTFLVVPASAFDNIDLYQEWH